MEFTGSLNRWYILPIGRLYATYHLLTDPETATGVRSEHRILLGHRQGCCHFSISCHQVPGGHIGHRRRWQDSHKNHYKWPHTWVTNWGEKNLLMGIITPLITGSDPPCGFVPWRFVAMIWGQIRQYTLRGFRTEFYRGLKLLVISLLILTRNPPSLFEKNTELTHAKTIPKIIYKI